MGILALDGVKDFQKVMRYSTETNEKKDVYFRVTVIVQAVLCLAKAIVVQLCRALMHLAAGRFKESGRDAASVGVQFVALPLLGIAAIISPPTAKGFTDKLAHHDVSRRNGKIIHLLPVSETPDKVSRGVGGSLAIFVAVADRGCYTLSKLIGTKDWKHLEGKKTLEHMGFGLIFSASLGTIAAFRTESGPEDLLSKIYSVDLPKPKPAEVVMA